MANGLEAKSARLLSRVSHLRFLPLRPCALPPGICSVTLPRALRRLASWRTTYPVGLWEGAGLGEEPGSKLELWPSVGRSGVRAGGCGGLRSCSCFSTPLQTSPFWLERAQRPSPPAVRGWPVAEGVRGSTRGARHVRPPLGRGARAAPSVGRWGVPGSPGPVVRLRGVGARGPGGVGAAGEPVRAAAGAAAVPPGREAAGPPRLPGRRPRAGGGERGGRVRPAGGVRRGATRGGRAVRLPRPAGVRGGGRAAPLRQVKPRAPLPRGPRAPPVWGLPVQPAYRCPLRKPPLSLGIRFPMVESLWIGRERGLESSESDDIRWAPYVLSWRFVNSKVDLSQG